MGTPAKERYCALCGTAKTSGGRKYCTACLKVVRKKNAEEHNKKMAAFYAAKKKAALPQGSSISDVCARAHAAGRTYGQQVEYERRQKELRDRGEID